MNPFTRSGLYILKDGKPVPEPNVVKWGRFFEQIKQRRVGRTRIGEFLVSTVFLGMDHDWSCKGPPVLWETMVFKGNSSSDLAMERCSGSREQAEDMHARMVKRVKGGMV